MEEHQKKHLPVAVFLAIVLGLLLVDYQYEKPGKDEFFLTSILQDWLRPSTITPELLQQTSLKDQEISKAETLETFFDPYLTLPEKTQASRYSIDGTSISISEVQTGNPLKIVQALISLEKPEYQFNKINAGTFYLNQIPLERKTHNFLGIVIKDVLYGFQYLPKEHPKVLEIIDGLNQNK